MNELILLRDENKKLKLQNLRIIKKYKKWKSIFVGPRILHLHHHFMANFRQLTSGEIVPKSSQTPNKLPNCCDLPLVKQVSRVIL